MTEESYLDFKPEMKSTRLFCLIYSIHIVGAVEQRLYPPSIHPISVTHDKAMADFGRITNC
jgi:hypothetical protein